MSRHGDRAARPRGLRLAAADEAGLVLDHVGQVNVFLIAGLLAPGGFLGTDGTPDMPELRSVLRRRLDSLPELTRRVVGRRQHRWVEAEPDLEHHVRLVEAVAGLAGLERRCGELMSRPLSLDRPLWEMLVVPDATGSRTGIVLRIHHTVADGMAAADIAQRLFDPQDRRMPRPPSAPTTAPSPGGSARAWRRLRTGVRRVARTLRAGGVGPTVLLGDRSASRAVVFLRADIAALEERAHACGATVNDALLAATAAGLRAALTDAGEALPALLPVSVPVALRRRGAAGNQVGVMLVPLPLREPDPDERLRRIAARTRVEKVRARDQGTFELMRGPIGARIMDAIARHQHLVAAFVTNVPGPPAALRLAGAPAEHVWPVAVLAGDVRVGIAALSHDGGLCCGVHVDAAHLDAASLAGAMRAELRRLTG